MTFKIFSPTVGRLASGCLLLAAALVGGCESPGKSSPANQEDSDRLKLSPAAVENAKLEVVRAGPARLDRVFQQAGEVVVDRRRMARVATPLGGLVAAVHVVEGETVEKGQLLITLESQDLADRKLAFVAAAQRLGPAQATYDRERKLFERKLTTKDDYLQKKAQAHEAGVALHQARQKLLVLGLDPKSLGAMGRQRASSLKELGLRAPLGGTVTQLSVVVGAAVSDTQSLGEIVDLSMLWGELRLTSGRIQGVAPGLEVEVAADGTGLVTKAKVEYVAQVADRATRSVVVRLAIPNPEGKVRPGMAITARFRVPGEEASITVPAGAVHEVEGRQVVFVRLSETEFEARQVKLGATDGDLVEVTRGLAAGAEVVAKNSLSLKAAYQNQKE